MRASGRENVLIGLISDTHGLLRPEAVQALQGVDLLIHAGDIGRPEILDGLRSIAPLVAIRGNNDTGPWAQSLPATEVVEVGQAVLYVLHNVKELDLDPAAAGFSAVISGHSHQPSVVKRGNVVFVNPGSAGPRRFKLPISVARLQVQGASLTAEVVPLAV